MEVSFIVWILLGMIFGFGINKMTDRPHANLTLDVVLGGASAVAGGMIIGAMTPGDQESSGVSAALGAVVTSVAVLFFYRFARGK